MTYDSRPQNIGVGTVHGTKKKKKKKKTITAITQRAQDTRAPADWIVTHLLIERSVLLSKHETLDAQSCIATWTMKMSVMCKRPT